MRTKAVELCIGVDVEVFLVFYATVFKKILAQLKNFCIYRNVFIVVDKNVRLLV